MGIVALNIEISNDLHLATPDTKISYFLLLIGVVGIGEEL